MLAAVSPIKAALLAVEGAVIRVLQSVDGSAAVAGLAELLCSTLDALRGLLHIVRRVVVFRSSEQWR